MSRHYLGETFDIHGGGLDLMFPHHENERAQSSCCHGAPMVKYWLHNGLMRAGAASGKVGGKSDREQTAELSAEEASAGKISRSKGGGGLADLIRRHTGERLRFFLLRTHYRSTIVFNEEGLQEAATSLDSFYRIIDRLSKILNESFYTLSAPRRRQDAPMAASKEAGALRAQELRSQFIAHMDDDFNTGVLLACCSISFERSINTLMKMD